MSNPVEVFGEPEPPLTYLHAECVPELLHRERLTRTHHALRTRHARYQQALRTALRRRRRS